MNGNTYSSTRFLKAPSSLAFYVSREGASTTNVGNVFQWFTAMKSGRTDCINKIKIKLNSKSLYEYGT